MIKYFILTLFFLSISCSKKVYDSNYCDELSMKSFKGFPREANEFNNNCSKVKVHYTSKLCQKALQKLVLGKSLDRLKEIFGEKIDGCFSQNDLKKFSSS